MRNFIWRIMQVFIRTSAFLRKEVMVVLRQPQLVLTLILGPFLILAIFGIGYQSKARELRTLFVASKNSPLRSEIEQYANTLGPQLIYEGVTDDVDGALSELRNGQVDVVVVTPNEAYKKIQSSEQAVFTLYHDEIDPFQVDYVKYFGQIYIDEVNRRVLLNITQEGQAEASNVQDNLSSAHQSATAMREAMQAGNMLAARQHQANLSRNLDAVSVAVGASLGLLSGVQDTVGSSGQTDAASILSTLTQARQLTDALRLSDNSTGSPTSEQVDQASQVEQDLAKLEDDLNQFTSISPNVIVSPFRSDAKGIAQVQPDALQFFAPAVIALLLQHLAITFAALSIVRENEIGAVELFRVAPLTSGETLIGKYLSYLIFGGLIALVLTLLLRFGLQVPMLGNWYNYALIVLALVFTSLGIGFFISLISKSDSQAVQYTMIVLLASVFFSGFIMSLDMIIPQVRVVSWALPTTYGIILLRDIFLRGAFPDPILLGGLAAIGLGFFLISWFLLHRQLSSK